jgi:hypothetical protein
LASITTTTTLRGTFKERCLRDSCDMPCDWESRLLCTLGRRTTIRRAYSRPKFPKTIRYSSSSFPLYRMGLDPMDLVLTGRRHPHRYTFIVSPTLQNSDSAYWIISPTCTSALPVCFHFFPPCRLLYKRNQSRRIKGLIFCVFSPRSDNVLIQRKHVSPCPPDVRHSPSIVPAARHS